jgi:DNA-binding transcriptional regulator YhcF (GntR family)
MLMKTASQSLTEQLSARFAERIRSRLLAPGARLPSVRLCAEQQGVSVSTVVAAYDQLLAQGLVVARKNRGFFVRDASLNAALLPVPKTKAADKPAQMDAAAGRLPLNAWSTAGWLHARQAPVDATALIRGMFHKVSNKPQPGMGVFPSDWLETNFMPWPCARSPASPRCGSFRCSTASPWATAACAARCRRN